MCNTRCIPGVLAGVDSSEGHGRPLMMNQLQRTAWTSSSTLAGQDERLRFWIPDVLVVETKLGECASKDPHLMSKPPSQIVSLEPLEVTQEIVCDYRNAILKKSAMISNKLLLLLLLLFYFILLVLASTKPAGLKIVKLDILLLNKISRSGGKNYVSGKVLLNSTALPRWSVTESLW